MTGTYTIEAADDGAAIDPRLLRELRDLLRNDEDVDVGVRLKDRPPAPGEQGAVPVALEIVAGAASLGTAFARVLRYWIEKNRLSVEVTNGGDSFKISAGNIADAERLFAMVEKSADARRRDAGG